MSFLDMLNLNNHIFLFVHGAVGHSVALDHVAVFITRFFVPLMMIGTAIWFGFILPRKAPTLGVRLRYYTVAGFFLLMLAIVWPAVELLKALVAFPRPVSLTALTVHTGLDSFPSLHTAVAFAVATFVYHYSKKGGILLFVLAILIGFSRIFVGVHYPVDVIAGAGIGIIISWVVVLIQKRFFS